MGTPYFRGYIVLPPCGGLASQARQPGIIQAGDQQEFLMGLFGGRRKAEQEEAERLRLEQEAERQRYEAQRSAENDRRSAERRARIMGWFEALEKDAAEGAPLLTDEILERVGPFPLPPREWKDREGRLEYVGDLAATKAQGRMVARNYMAMAHDKSDAAFWASVNEYCEGVLAGT